MACYPCTHCNKCGMYSVRSVTVCSGCRAPITAGLAACPECGGRKFETQLIPLEDEPSETSEHFE